MALNRLHCYQKWFLPIIWSHYPSPYVQFGQNVLLNDCSLRTFASLTPKYRGSFIRVFTVFKNVMLAKKGLLIMKWHFRKFPNGYLKNSSTGFYESILLTENSLLGFNSMFYPGSKVLCEIIWHENKVALTTPRIWLTSCGRIWPTLQQNNGL